MSYGIYMIRCVENGKVYIGKSRNPYSRIGDHFTNLKAEAAGTIKCRRQHSVDMVKDFAKYGETGFEAIVLKIGIAAEEASAEEGNFIQKYRSCEPDRGYNIRSEKKITPYRNRPFFISCECETLYEKIKMLCREKGLTVSELEKEIGLENSTIISWKRCTPRTESIQKVASFFGLPVDALVVEVYAKTVRKKMIDRDMTVEQLTNQVSKKTGRFFDNSYFSKICNGRLSTPYLISAINEILEIQEGDA